MTARHIPYLQRGPNFGVDLNALAVEACKRIDAKNKARRQALESGVREHQWELADSLAVAQEAAEPLPNDPLRAPRTRWRTISTPDGIPELVVLGSLPEAEANKWTLHELMTRRMRRAYRDALVGLKIMDSASANKRAMATKVHVVDVGLSLG